MNRKSLLVGLLCGVLVTAGVFGAFTYTSVKASAAPAQTAGVDFHGRGFGYTQEDLAQALGISVDQLNSATEQATSAALDQAVSQGVLTQAQADQIRSRGTAFPFGRGWERELSQAGIDYNALLAQALGISASDLQAAYQKAAAAAIDRAVSAGQLTEDQANLLKGQSALAADPTFQTAMQNAFTAAVNQAVSDGVITQAQADQILQNATGMGSSGFWGMKGLPGFRESGRHGGWGDEAPFGPGQATPQSTPSNEG